MAPRLNQGLSDNHYTNSFIGRVNFLLPVSEDIYKEYPTSIVLSMMMKLSRPLLFLSLTWWIELSSKTKNIILP